MDTKKISLILQNYGGLQAKIQEFLKEPFPNIKFVEDVDEDDEYWHERHEHLPCLAIIEDGYGEYYLIYGLERVGSVNYFSTINPNSMEERKFETWYADTDTLIQVLGLMKDHEINN